MQSALKGIDLTRAEVVVPAPLAAAVISLKAEIAEQLLQHGFIKGRPAPESTFRSSSGCTGFFEAVSLLTLFGADADSDGLWAALAAVLGWAA